MLMSSPSQPPGRMSQVLPSISCSQCRAQIPLDELGDHICKPAPPLPTLNLPKPVLSPGAAASLLPQRLQGRVVQPPVSPRSPQPPPAQSPRSSSSTFRGGESLRLNTSGPPRRTASPSRSSPLSRTGDGPPPPRDPYASRGESPVRNRPPIAPFSRARSGSNASSTMSSPTTARPSFSSTRDVPPPSAIRPPPPAETGLNTQIGGEAGMAGVGRRGFAAAARAAMFATSVPAPPPSQQTRANPPRNLDIGAATGNTSTPPPLSTSTGSSNSPGLAPFPESPVSPQPYERRRSPSPPLSRQPASISSKASTSSRPSKGPGSVSQSSESEYGLAYADSTDYEDDDDDSDLRRVNDEMRNGVGSFRTKDPPPPLPLESGSKSRVQQANPAPPPRAPSKRKDSLSSESGSDYDGASSLKRSNSAVVAQALGLAQTPPSAYGRRGGPGQAPSRSVHSRGGSSGSAQSAYSSKSAIATGEATATPSGGPSGSGKGRLERQMENMVDERPALAKSKSVQGPQSPEGRTLKLPTRSRTSPTSERSSSREPKRERAGRAHKAKVCVRCEKTIDDGKWVQVDGGGVLCEKCWKNMYLPKCRRCNLPIEKQAVSSSDGQLKGKYHRECFNCHTCHKPFPDKTFYVLDGKPLCAYHYHEANDSLCAAARCGQPIEGPCAVSHAGDRYHPEHMLCEFPGGCKERLEEYWEVDGRMLCERHSRVARQDDDDDDDERGWKPSSRAMKRVTRYIDLANGRR